MLITATHANLNTSVEVDTKLLFSWYYSDTHKCTLLLASGGAMIPVKESVEQIKQLTANLAVPQRV